MSDSARGQLEKEIERQQRELERLQQDAQAELNELQQELQDEFQKKLLPVLEQLSKEKGLQFLFSGADAGLIWAEPGLDLTLDAVKKLDGRRAKPLRRSRSNPPDCRADASCRHPATRVHLACAAGCRSRQPLDRLRCCSGFDVSRRTAVACVRV